MSKKTISNESNAIKQGSTLTAFLNRSALRSYALKIESGEISHQELKDYIVKGGSLNQYKRYNNIRDFFVSAPEHSVLNFFLDRRNFNGEKLAENRLEMLSTLLNSGANPNFNIKAERGVKYENFAPILEACAVDDLEAITLFVNYNANLELTEYAYLGDAGPCLAMANSVTTLDFLLSENANIHYQDQNGNSLLHLAIEFASTYEKIQWLVNNGVSTQHENIHGDKAIDRVKDLISARRHNIENHKQSELDTEQAKPEINEEIINQQEHLTRLQRLLDIL